MLKLLFILYRRTFIIFGVIMLGILAALLITNLASSPAPAKSSNDIITVAAIGDSNTAGAGVQNDNIEKNSYPAQLQQLLGEKYRVLNYGLGGTTLISSSSHAYSKTEFYKESQSIAPDIVLIMLGTNDSTTNNWNAAQYEQDLVSFVNTYKHLTNSPSVYLLTVPFAYIPGSTALPTEINGGTVTNEVVPIIRRVAKLTNTPVIDIYAATKNQSSLFPDRVHLTAAGYGVIANQVYQALLPKQSF